MLTTVLPVMEGSGEHLSGASKVEEVELWVEGEEHVNGLIGHRRGL